MPILVVNKQIGFIRLWMTITDFPHYLEIGLNSDPATRYVEKEAKSLIQAGFPEQQTISFVKSVCKWGNYPGVGGRVIKNNTPDEIVSAMRSATKATNEGNVEGALKELLRLKGLAVSFASKHLKFLDPTKHVVLDSVISSKLGYPMSTEGYREFVADCQQTLEFVIESKVPCPIEDQVGWRIADIEMAIFQKLRS